jgi:hypothetical protein
LLHCWQTNIFSALYRYQPISSRGNSISFCCYLHLQFFNRQRLRAGRYKIPAQQQALTVSGNAMTNWKTTMTAYILTIILLASCLAKTNTPKLSDPSKLTANTLRKDTSLNGMYVGLEEMCWTDSTGKKDCYSDPARPKRKWYHLGYLKIKGDSAFLDQNPVNIGIKKDTLWSASDGAFYYYSGTVQKSDTTISINLKELFCDYCGVPVKIKPDGSKEVIKRTKQLKGRLSDKGIIIDGYLYALTIEKESLTSEHPEPYLKSQ